MRLTNQFLAAALAGFSVLATAVAAQQPTQQPAPQQPPSPQQPTPPAPQPPETTGRGGRCRGQGGGQGGGREFATFPAQQRQLADAETIAKGKGLFTTNCSTCHGVDLRGGVTGGPNLLRSQVVLTDQHGELILPIVHGARAERGMPALPLPDQDVVAIAEDIHGELAAVGRQGRPPEAGGPAPNPIVGDAAAGEKYFTAKCSSCH